VHGTARLALTLVAVLGAATPAAAFRPLPLDAKDQKILRDNFALCTAKLKGPYTENFCVCPDGRKIPVRSASGQIGSGCKDPLFCAAFRAPWAEALAKERVYIANIFSRDLYLWDSFPDHRDLVRGYILENYFTATHPEHKLGRLRAFGGLSGAEYETPASARFFERFLSAPDFNDNRDFLLAYELQKRYFVRADLGQIEKVRALSVRIQNADPRFKPLRDAVHNQISPGLVAQLAAYRDPLPPSATRNQIDELIAEIKKLTSLDESELTSQVAEIGDVSLRGRLAALVPAGDPDPVRAISSLAQLMVLDRETVAARTASAADARRLVDLNVTATGVIQQRGNALLQSATGLSVGQSLQLLSALTDATYGTGLLGRREREAAAGALRGLLGAAKQPRREFAAQLAAAERAVEWAQSNALLAFAEVWAPWTFVLPQTASIKDDILRSSPLLLYAQVSRRLDDYAAGTQRARHDLFGAEGDSDVRALNPGLALGRLRVAPKGLAYTRDDIVALPETPADLDPAAGILTQGEGNVLSHVQLLARALGIPNVVLGTGAYQRIAPHDGRRVFFIVTPRGRVIIKEASAMTAQDDAVYEEYTRNQARKADGSLAGGGARLHIDRARIDLSKNMPIDLNEVRRKDSGRFCGPKAAYLGELKHLFPDHVARGIVVPFGAYHDHYQNAKVTVPEALRRLDIARAGEPLPDFVERTYEEFFHVLIPAKKNEEELAAWIKPRLEVIRSSIRQAPLSAELRRAIRDGLDADGLLQGDDKSQSVGCFVRSDTNVEDLDNFNGAGLNLTVFNRKSLDDIYEGLREVWASPFEFRSFSWRQTLIDDPVWVLSSVVILESVPNDKSGVLVTADFNTGDTGKMTIATSEGVGGAVDGTSAETLLWSPNGIELLSLFKSPWKNQLLAGGGSAIVPASGSDTVLQPGEIEQVVAAGRKIAETLAPALNPAGRPRPWDIEFGFKDGKLWLFQCRPFLGNDELKNIPALAPLEGPNVAAHETDMLSLEDIIR
jgi:Pyruvate phosphate dikinase, AMP/ATP-binding domain